MPGLDSGKSNTTSRDLIINDKIRKLQRNEIGRQRKSGER